MLQATFRIERLFVVPAGAFRPVPKVESAVARLVPLREDAPRIDDKALFARIVAGAFMQRRKTLRNALSHITDEATLTAAGIDPQARGETLGGGGFRAPDRRGQSQGGCFAGPLTRTILRRADAPLTIVTSALRTLNAWARKSTSASLARPSTAGAARRILCASPCRPAYSVRDAPGCT